MAQLGPIATTAWPLYCNTIIIKGRCFMVLYMSSKGQFTLCGHGLKGQDLAIDLATAIALKAASQTLMALACRARA